MVGPCTKDLPINDNQDTYSDCLVQILDHQDMQKQQFCQYLTEGQHINNWHMHIVSIYNTMLLERLSEVTLSIYIMYIEKSNGPRTEP